MFQISLCSERSKVTLKPQPAQCYHHPNAEVVDEMEVNSLVTPKATSTANNPPATQPKSPASQPTVGGTSKALPPGLNFSRAVTAGSSTSTATPAVTISAAPATVVSTNLAAASASPAVVASATPAALEGAPAVTAEPNGPGSGNAGAVKNTVYHQIGQPHLTGPNPIPAPGVAAAPPHQPPYPIDKFHPPAKYELVPRPEGGFPDIKGQTYKTIRAHFARATLSLWEKQTGPGVITFSPADNGTVDTAKVTLFREMLRDAIHAPDLFIIAPTIMHNVYTEHKPVTLYRTLS